MALVVGLLLNWKPAGSGALSAFAREIACRAGAVALLLSLSAFLSALRLCTMCSLQGKTHLLLALLSLHIMDIVCGPLTTSHFSSNACIAICFPVILEHAF